MENKTREELYEEIEDLKARLQDEQEYSRAIRNGEVDALVISGPSGEQVFTLNEADRPYRIIIEEMSEGAITTNDQGVILYSNKQFSKMLGVPLSKLMGSSLYEYISPENHQAIQEIISSSRESTGRAEIVFEGGEGKTVWANVSFSPLQIDQALVFYGIITDITFQKNARKALQESEERFRTSVETMIDAFTIFSAIRDESGNIYDFRNEYTNTSGFRLFHGTHEDLDGCTLLELFPFLKNTGLFDQFIQVIKTGEPMIRESVQIEGAHGVDKQSARYYDLQAVKLQDGLAITWRDVTEHLHSEEERKSLEAQVNQSQRIEALDRFAGGIAHDLNNILYPIIINTETLLAEEQTESSREILNQTLKASYRQRDLIKQILSFSRRSEQKLSPVKIVPLIEETIDFLKSTLPSTIDIHFDISASTDVVMGHSTQIQQVVMNLCQNAADALESQKGTIEVKLVNTYLEPVHIRQEIRAGEYLQLTVRDTGSGMPPEILDRIFEPFFTTKEMGKGTGMGLSVVYGIVKNHGGAVTVESGLGKGTIFTVYLPAYEGEPEAKADPVKKELSVKEKGTILLIDDEEIILTSLQRALRTSGYRVVAVKDSARALQLFAKSPDEYDLIITDLTMPGTTGIELVGKFLGIRPGIPIILCTGFNDAINDKKAKSLGIKELLLKPTGTSELKSAVRRALES